MNMVAAGRKVVVTGAVALALGAALGASQAGAASPWWHVDVASAPADAPGTEALVLVDVGNLGDKLVNLAENPVTVVDRLPAGVTPTRAFGEGGGSLLGRAYAPFFTACTIQSQTVTCVREGFVPLLPYEHIMIAIWVKVAAGAGMGADEASVASVGTPPASIRRPLALSDAPAPFGVQSYEVTPDDEGGALVTQAGSHPFQLTTTLELNSNAVQISEKILDGGATEPRMTPAAMSKDLHFNLPPGLIGNPTPLPKCSMYEFTEQGNIEVSGAVRPHCASNTVVGVASTTSYLAVAYFDTSSNHVPFESSDPLYNLEPSAGEPARFGFYAGGAVPVILDTQVRTGGDYGVVVTVPNITEVRRFSGSEVTFWGAPGDPRHDTSRGECLDKPNFEAEPLQWEPSCPLAERGRQAFLIMPTSCAGPWRTTVEADAWTAPGLFTSGEYTSTDAGGRPYKLDGCDRLNFEPSISVAPDGQQGATPTGLTVGVHVPQEASLNPSGLADATVKDTTVTLPAGVGLNPASADGLEACGLAQIGLESAAEQSCPEASKVGTVEIETPLLPNKLEGAAYLAQQGANPFGSLLALYLVARDPVSGVLVKLAGQVRPDPMTGQLTSTFTETPQLPFENLRLHFFGGSRAPLGTPAQCGSYTTRASITPWSESPPVESSSTFEITSGPNHSPCRDPLSFAPELTAGSSNIQAGGFTPFTMTMSREDGNQNLDGIQLHMPPGLSGLLTGVELCPEPQADQGLCGPNSLIGETTVSVGLGSTPYTVKGGRVYVTGPYHGAPFGLSIVNPAKAGPFDLESTATHKPACDCVVVRAKLEVDPLTAALTVTSDTSGEHAIPTIIEGVPLQIKHVNVRIDRPGFTFNPTDCQPMNITGAITSAEGSMSTIAVPFQVTNCATLKFAPSFSASTSARTSKANGASLNVKLTYPNAPQGTQANIHSVKVELPLQLPSRLTTLQKACTERAFDANPALCPAASIVGHVVARTPILPVPVQGPAYFVSHGGAKFPELIVVLQGYGVTIELHGETFISKEGITSSTFATVPDVPVGSFELTLPRGPYSALTANGNLCSLTRTITQRKRTTVKVRGHRRTRTRRVRKTVPATLQMPTSFVAQNGATLKQSTRIAVTGCAKKAMKKRRGRAVRHAGRGRNARGRGR